MNKRRYHSKVDISCKILETTFFLIILDTALGLLDADKSKVISNLEENN